MQEITIFYNSYTLEGDGPELQQLTTSVTELSADTIAMAAATPKDQWDGELTQNDLLLLNRLAAACEGIEQLGGRTIYKRAGRYPKRFIYGPAYALEITRAELAPGEDGGEDDGTEG